MSGYPQCDQGPRQNKVRGYSPFYSHCKHKNGGMDRGWTVRPEHRDRRIGNGGGGGPNSSFYGLHGMGGQGFYWFSWGECTVLAAWPRALDQMVVGKLIHHFALWADGLLL